MDIHKLSEVQPQNGELCLINTGHYWREAFYVTEESVMIYKGYPTVGFYAYGDFYINPYKNDVLWFKAPDSLTSKELKVSKAKAEEPTFSERIVDFWKRKY